MFNHICLDLNPIFCYQVDLDPDDVFMLDAYDMIYLWIGQDSRPEEKKFSIDAAKVGLQETQQS